MLRKGSYFPDFLEPRPGMRLLDAIQGHAPAMSRRLWERDYQGIGERYREASNYRSGIRPGS